MAKDVTKQIDALKDALGGALGGNLAALLLYGSAARSTARVGGDVNLLLIVRDASATALKPVADAIDRWVEDGHPAPMIFGLDEWKGSADVFPIEIEDMREAHRLLLGSDPFPGVSTTHADLRAELERETRSKLLHLRTAYAAAAKNGKALGRLLEQSSGSILALLRAALRVAGRPVPAEVPTQAAEAAALIGADPKAFEWVLARRTGAGTGELNPYDERAVRYVDAVQKLASWADGQ